MGLVPFLIFSFVSFPDAGGQSFAEVKGQTSVGTISYFLFTLGPSCLDSRYFSTGNFFFHLGFHCFSRKVFLGAVGLV